MVSRALVFGGVLVLAAGCGSSAGTGSAYPGNLTATEVVTALTAQGFHVHSDRMSKQPPTNGQVRHLPGVRIVAIVSGNTGRASIEGRPLVVLLSNWKSARRYFAFERGELSSHPGASRPSSLFSVGNVVGGYFPARTAAGNRTGAFKRAMVQLEVNPAVNPKS